MLFVVKVSIKYVSICEKGTTFTILSIQNISIGLIIRFYLSPFPSPRCGFEKEPKLKLLSNVLCTECPKKKFIFNVVIKKRRWCLFKKNAFVNKIQTLGHYFFLIIWPKCDPACSQYSFKRDAKFLLNEWIFACIRTRELGLPLYVLGFKISTREKIDMSQIRAVKASLSPLVVYY